MSYKERVVTTKGYSRLQNEADDGMNMAVEFENKETIKGEDPLVLIPFHSVDRVVKTTAMEDRADKNPYYCEPDGGDGVCSSKVCTAKVACDD